MLDHIMTDTLLRKLFNGTQFKSKYHYRTFLDGSTIVLIGTAFMLLALVSTFIENDQLLFSKTATHALLGLGGIALGSFIRNLTRILDSLYHRNDVPNNNSSDKEHKP